MSKKERSFPADAARSKEKETFTGIMLEYMEIVVFSICAVLVLFMLVGRLCRVNGDSMRNTLYDGEMLITTSLGEIERGDIVVFHQTSEHYHEPLVKRVIGVGGDTIRIDYNTSKVFCNGEEVDEPYAALLAKQSGGGYTDIGYMSQKPHYNYDSASKIFEVTVPEGSYFVMGDNRNNSADSRTTEIGCVDARRMLGRVVLRLYPYTTFD